MTTGESGVILKKVFESEISHLEEVCGFIKNQGQGKLDENKMSEMLKSVCESLVKYGEIKNWEISLVFGYLFCESIREMKDRTEQIG